MLSHSLTRMLVRQAHALDKCASLLTPPGSVFEVTVGSGKLTYAVGSGSSQVILVVNGAQLRESVPPLQAPRHGLGAMLLADGPVDQRMCQKMLDCYAQGPGAPLSYPAAPLLACGSSVEPGVVALLALAPGAADRDMSLAHAFKAVSWELRRTIDTVVIISTARADGQALQDKVKPWLLYLNPCVTCTVALSSGAGGNAAAAAAGAHGAQLHRSQTAPLSRPQTAPPSRGEGTDVHGSANGAYRYREGDDDVIAYRGDDVELAMRSASRNDASVLVMCEASVDEVRVLSERLCLDHTVDLPADSGQLVVTKPTPRKPETLACVARGASALVELHCASNRRTGADAAGWLPLPPWVEEDAVAWPWCDGKAAPRADEPAYNRCGPGFDGSLAFSSFYSQWAPVPAATIRRPLRMHGVWTPRCDQQHCKGTVIFCPGVTSNNPDVQRQSMQGLRARLLGVHAKVHPDHAKHLHDVEALPETVSGFRCYYPSLPHCPIYQLPCGVVLLAAAIDSILALERGPIVLVGHSLSGAIVPETVTRVIDHYDPGSIAGVCLLAPQVPGLHCDNKSGVNSMKSTCKRLGEKGVPLTVCHGTADTAIPMHCGQQIAEWHAEGMRLRGPPAGLSNFHAIDGDIHGMHTAGKWVRDFVAGCLGV